MVRLQGFLQRQIELLLMNQQRAFLYALMFATFPYTAWLAVILIALVTLRKGWSCGALLLIPVMIAHVICSLMNADWMVAIMNTLTLFLPCYMAACVLRMTTSWQAVFAIFFLEISLAALCVQWFVPDFVMTQYLYLKTILKETQSDSTLSNLLQDTSLTSRLMLASYTFGVQMLSVTFSAFAALLIARSTQSRLFNPGGFSQEWINFRASKIGLVILVILFSAALQKNMIAMMVLPALIMYFLLSGLRLTATVLIRKKTRLVVVLSIVSLICLPFVMVPLYSLLGILDSLFDLKVATLKYKRQ